MIYEATISYVKIDTNGNDKTVKEQYIIENADLFTEVEMRMHNNFGTLPNYDVTAIKRSRIHEVCNVRDDEDDKIYVATLVDTFTNEDGSEKEVKYQVAFFADDIANAHAFIEKYADQGYNMRISGIKETSFINVL